MAKIMLVEDDNNLREIYEARLMAEGYDIVSARDGEEALTVAIKEKPDLVISDVMMPKISGFDMLDILRTTEETKHVKVIMMTALSQAEDKARAEKLGADRYLVKSQVTLEDVAKVAKEVLEGSASDSPAPAAPAPAPTPAPAPEPTTSPAVAPAPTAETPMVEATPAEPQKAQRKIIEPLNDVHADMSPKLHELAAKEEASESQPTPSATATPTTVAPTPDLELPKPAPAPTEDKVDPNLIAL